MPNDKSRIRSVGVCTPTERNTLQGHWNSKQTSIGCCDPKKNTCHRHIAPCKRAYTTTLFLYSKKSDQLLF